MRDGRAAQLVGRDHEVDVLRHVVERVARGTGTVVVLEGEAGIGKTRLVQELVAAVHAASLEIYVGRAVGIERSRPLAAVTEALLPLREDIATLDVATVPSVLVDELERRALRRPLVTVIEDLHWADPATLEFVHDLAQRSETAPIALVVSTRPPHGKPELAHLVERLRSAGAEAIDVRALGSHDVEALVRSLSDSEPSAAVLEQVARAGGNPFYVNEVVAALAEDPDSNAASTRLQPSLRLTILRRLAVLPEPTLEDLRSAAVLGASFDVEDLALITERDAFGVMRSLRLAFDAGVIVQSGDRHMFRHDLVHAALYEDIPEGLRKRIHRRFGEALANAERPATVVAPHYALSADGIDAQAAVWLERAGRSAMSSSAEIAVAFFLRSADLSPRDQPERPGLFVLASMALGWMGRVDEAEAILRRVLDGPIVAAIRANATDHLARTIVDHGRLDEAASLLRSVIDDEASDVIKRFEAIVNLGFVEFERGDFGSTLQLVAEGKVLPASAALRAIASVEQIADTDVVVAALYALLESLVASAEGQARSALERMRETGQLDLRGWRDLAEEISRRFVPALVLLGADRVDDGLALIHAGYPHLVGMGWKTARLEAAASVIRYCNGTWDRAAADAGVTVSTTTEARAKATSGIATSAFAIAARLALHAGDSARARSIIEHADEWIEAGIESFDRTLLSWAKGLVAEAEGDGALETMEDGFRTTAKHRYLFGAWRFLFPDLVRLAQAAGRRDLVREVLDATDLGVERAEGLGSHDAVGQRVHGLAADDPNLLLAAYERFRDSPRATEAAAVAAEAGLSLARAGDGRATAVLRDALDRLDELGAVRDADLLRAAMRDLGLRAGVRGSRKRAEFGWDALTATEVRVVGLLGEGLTNRQIAEHLYISPRTVQTHLRNVFGKLGASSRAEVAAQAARRT